MLRFPLKYSSVLALVVGLAFVACEQPTGPQTALLDAPDAQTTLIENSLAQGSGLEIAELIGPRGGEITLAGYTLTVPAGALDEPMLFTLGLSNDDGVQVALSAAIERDGEFVGIDNPTFDSPLRFALPGGSEFSFTELVAASNNLLPTDINLTELVAASN